MPNLAHEQYRSALADMANEIENLLDTVEDTAAENVAARYGLDPEELLTRYKEEP